MEEAFFIIQRTQDRTSRLWRLLWEYKLTAFLRKGIWEDSTEQEALLRRIRKDSVKCSKDDTESKSRKGTWAPSIHPLSTAGSAKQHESLHVCGRLTFYASISTEGPTDTRSIIFFKKINLNDSIWLSWIKWNSSEWRSQDKSRKLKSTQNWLSLVVTVEKRATSAVHIGQRLE